MGPKQMGGVAIGASLGGLAGSKIGSGGGQMAAVAIGALLGGLMGGEAGKSLDRSDRMYASQSAQQGLENNPAGHAAVWRNPDTGHSGSVTPTRTYVTRGGVNCRDYDADIYIEGRKETAKGVACRQANGTWKVMDEQTASAGGSSEAKPPVYTQTPSGQWRSSTDVRPGPGGLWGSPGGDARFSNRDWRVSSEEWQAPDID